MRDAARKRFLYAESEKQEIRAYQPLFVELQRRHFVGTESRLDWVDAIRQIQERRRLLPLTYEIEPQQPYKIEGRLPTGDYQLLGSRMTLHMDLLHEMEIHPPDTLFGLYQGVPLTERTWDYGNRMPDRIVIYQRPIEAACEGDADAVLKAAAESEVRELRVRDDDLEQVFLRLYEEGAA